MNKAKILDASLCIRAEASLMKIIGLGSLLFLAACTTLPTEEFASYKDAFSKARSAGEEVLVDYAAALAQKAQIDTKRKLAAKPKPPARPVPFDPQAITNASQAIDHVAVRFRAWEVVAKYNDALTRLAEGQSAQQVASAVGGLVDSLSDFPINEFKDLATEISPFLAPLKVLIAEAEKERSRQEFLTALGRGAPIITERFIKLLKDDTVNFYNIRLGLNDFEYDPLVDQIADEAQRCEALAGGFLESKETTNPVDLLDGINVSLAQLPVKTGGKAPVGALKYQATGKAVPYNALARDALQQCKRNTDELISRALEKDAEIGTYRDVLTAYVILLDKTAASLNAVQKSAARNTTTAPPSKELLNAVITLRQALLNYKH